MTFRAVGDMINITENRGENESFEFPCLQTYKDGLHESTLTTGNQMGGRHFRKGVGLTSFDVVVTAIAGRPVAKKYAMKTYPR